MTDPPEAEASAEREAHGSEEPLKLCPLSLLIAILFLLCPFRERGCLPHS